MPNVGWLTNEFVYCIQYRLGTQLIVMGLWRAVVYVAIFLGLLYHRQIRNSTAEVVALVHATRLLLLVRASAWLASFAELATAAFWQALQRIVAVQQRMVTYWEQVRDFPYIHHIDYYTATLLCWVLRLEETAILSPTIAAPGAFPPNTADILRGDLEYMLSSVGWSIPTTKEGQGSVTKSPDFNIIDSWVTERRPQFIPLDTGGDEEDLYNCSRPPSRLRVGSEHAVASLGQARVSNYRAPSAEEREEEEWHYVSPATASSRALSGILYFHRSTPGQQQPSELAPLLSSPQYALPSFTDQSQKAPRSQNKGRPPPVDTQASHAAFISQRSPWSFPLVHSALNSGIAKLSSNLGPHSPMHHERVADESPARNLTTSTEPDSAAAEINGPEQATHSSHDIQPSATASTEARVREFSNPRPADSIGYRLLDSVRHKNVTIADIRSCGCTVTPAGVVYSEDDEFIAIVDLLSDRIELVSLDVKRFLDCLSVQADGSVQDYSGTPYGNLAFDGVNELVGCTLRGDWLMDGSGDIVGRMTRAEISAEDLLRFQDHGCLRVSLEYCLNIDERQDGAGRSHEQYQRERNSPQLGNLTKVTWIIESPGEAPPQDIDASPRELLSAESYVDETLDPSLTPDTKQDFLQDAIRIESVLWVIHQQLQQWTHWPHGTPDPHDLVQSSPQVLAIISNLQGIIGALDDLARNTTAGYLKLPINMFADATRLITRLIDMLIDLDFLTVYFPDRVPFGTAVTPLARDIQLRLFELHEQSKRYPDSLESSETHGNSASASEAGLRQFGASGKPLHPPTPHTSQHPKRQRRENMDRKRGRARPPAPRLSGNNRPTDDSGSPMAVDAYNFDNVGSRTGPLYVSLPTPVPVTPVNTASREKVDAPASDSKQGTDAADTQVDETKERIQDRPSSAYETDGFPFSVAGSLRRIQEVRDIITERINKYETLRDQVQLDRKQGSDLFEQFRRSIKWDNWSEIAAMRNGNHDEHVREQAERLWKDVEDYASTMRPEIGQMPPKAGNRGRNVNFNQDQPEADNQNDEEEEPFQWDEEQVRTPFDNYPVSGRTHDRGYQSDATPSQHKKRKDKSGRQPASDERSFREDRRSRSEAPPSRLRNNDQRKQDRQTGGGYVAEDDGRGDEGRDPSRSSGLGQRGGKTETNRGRGGRSTQGRGSGRSRDQASGPRGGRGNTQGPVRRTQAPQQRPQEGDMDAEL